MGTSHAGSEDTMPSRSIEEVVNSIIQYESNCYEMTKGSLLINHLEALVREAGEVIKAVLDCKDGKGSLSDVHKELIQTTAMCHRMLRNLHLIEKEPLKLESKHIDFKKLLGEPQFTNDGGYSESQVFEAMEKLINVK